MELATSGISGLDAQLGGGFPRGTTVLVLGDPCNALSVFAEQFTAGGLAQGEDALFFQFDRPARGVSERVRGLAQDMGGAKGQLRVLDGYSAQFSANGHHGEAADVRLPRENVLGVVLDEAMKVGAGKYRLAIDSLSTLCRLATEQEVLDVFRHLVHLGQEANGMQLVTVIKGLHSPQFEAQLKHAATGVMEVGVERKGFGLYNYLQVTKLLNLHDPTRILLFKETERGLWLESTRRVF
jgi:KaiC/GvpD/RAD55 family RecA-like ATPase